MGGGNASGLAAGRERAEEPSASGRPDEAVRARTESRGTATTAALGPHRRVEAGAAASAPVR